MEHTLLQMFNVHFLATHKKTTNSGDSELDVFKLAGSTYIMQRKHT